jgi:hypothetical protein
MSVVWIASYPRSGNTWLRFLLCGYFYGRPESPEYVSSRIPDIHAIEEHDRDAFLRRLGTGRVLVKTHFVPSRIPAKDIAEGYIHIQRDTKDVFSSAVRYDLGGDPDPFEVRRYGDEFLSSLGSLRWHALGYGSAVMHDGLWADSGLSGCHITYEDLRSDTFTTMERVLEFLGEPVDEDRLDQAIEWASLGRMRRMEDDGGKFHHMTLRERFIGDGVIGSVIGDKRLDAAFDALAGRNGTGHRRWP